MATTRSSGLGADLRVVDHVLLAHKEAHADALQRAYERRQRADGFEAAAAEPDVTAGALQYHPFVLAGRYHTYKVASAFPVPGGAIQDDKRRVADVMLRACTCGGTPCTCNAHDIAGIHQDAARVSERTAIRAAARAAAAEQRALTEAAGITSRLQAAGISMTNTVEDNARAAETYAAQLLHATRWPREEGVFPTSEHDATALHCVRVGNTKRLAELLEHADVAVDAAEPTSLRTGLMVAVSLANYDAVKLLLQHGADCNKMSATGSAPLHCVWDSWQRSKGQLMVQTQRILPALNHIARALLQHGAHANARTVSGFTPLHFAAMHNHGAIATMLMKAGADASIPDSRGRNAIAIAHELGHKDVLTVLQNWHHVQAYSREHAALAGVRAARAGHHAALEDSSTNVKDLTERWRVYEGWMGRRHAERDAAIDAARSSLPARYSNFAQYNPRTKTVKQVDIVQLLTDGGEPDAARRMEEAVEEQAREQSGGASATTGYQVNGRVRKEYARAMARANARGAAADVDALPTQSTLLRASVTVDDDDDDATSVAAVMDGGDAEAADYKVATGAASGGTVKDDALPESDPMSAAVLATLRERGVVKDRDRAAIVSTSAASAAETRVLELEPEQGQVWGALGMEKLLLMGDRGGYAHVGRDTLLQPRGMRHIVATPAVFAPTAAAAAAALTAAAAPAAVARPQLLDASVSTSGAQPSARATARQMMITDADGMIRLRDPREVAAEAAAAAATGAIRADEVYHPLAGVKHSESATDVMLAVVHRRSARLQYAQRVHDAELSRLPPEAAMKAAAVPKRAWARPTHATTTADRRAGIAAQLMRDTADDSYADTFTHVLDERVMTRRPAVASSTLRPRRAVVQVRAGVALQGAEQQDALQQLMLGKFAPPR